MPAPQPMSSATPAQVAAPFTYRDAPVPVRAGENSRGVAILPIQWMIGARIGVRLDTLGAEEQGTLLAGRDVTREQMESAVRAIDRHFCDLGYNADPTIHDSRDTSSTSQVVLQIEWKTLSINACSNRGKPFAVGSASCEASVWVADGSRSLVRRPLNVRTSCWGDAPTLLDSLAGRLADAITADSDLRLALTVPRSHLRKGQVSPR